MVVLIFGLALAVGTAQERFVARLRASTLAVKRSGGYILIAVGTWFLLLAIFSNFFKRALFPG